MISYNPGYQSLLKDLKQSTKQRFTAFDFDYPPASVETEILSKETGMDKDISAKLVKIGAAARHLKGHGLDEGIGELEPAVRIQVNPGALTKYDIGWGADHGDVDCGKRQPAQGLAVGRSRTCGRSTTSDQLFTAAEYAPLIVAYKNGGAVRLSDIATVTDSLENRRNIGLANGKPSVLIQITKQPSANIIDTVDNVYALLPQLKASIPPSMNLSVIVDRTTTIRASISDIEYTILISIGLVILVVFLFLRNVWATIIPSISVPLSLLGTFGVMYLLGYSVDNLSLMALAISTGFVVDDAIVVIENISRYLELGFSPAMAALKGAKEIAFTVSLHERVADRGVHSDSSDGWHCRPAVSRVLGNAGDSDRDFARGLADNDTFAVRQVPQAGSRAKARPAVPSVGKSVRRNSGRISRVARLGAASIRCSCLV